MGFLDKAKAAATELSAKADQALSSQGLAGPSAGGKQTDKYFRDLGVLAYLEATGRPADAGERDRIMSALQGFEGQGAMPSFALQTTAPPPPVPWPRGMPPRRPPRVLAATALPRHLRRHPLALLLPPPLPGLNQGMPPPCLLQPPRLPRRHRRRRRTGAPLRLLRRLRRTGAQSLRLRLRQPSSGCRVTAQPPVRDARVQTCAYSAVMRSMRCSTSGRRSAHALIPTSSRP